MTAPKPTHKPVGTVGMMTIGFFVIWGLLFVLFGYRDIRDGDPGSPSFMLGFLLVIFFVMRSAFRRKPPAAGGGNSPQPPRPK